MGMGFAVTGFAALGGYLLTVVLRHFLTATPSCVFYYYLVLSLYSFGSKTNFRYIPIHEIVLALNPSICKTLPVFHAFTGCDTTSMQFCW